MAGANTIIRDFVEARPHATVVRLDDLEAEDSAWLSESFVVTSETKAHLHALRRRLGEGQGGGAFLIGSYGCGKSHFLAYLTRELRAGTLVAKPPDVVPVSLVNFSAANRLEDIVSGALGIDVTDGDRRPAWDAMLAARAGGLLLVLDELSEFLRAKASPHAFSEDVRFLQFMGEWAEGRRFYVLAAMQEGIEHTGELEYSLYRKIKDRYPLRLLLTPAHVEALVADGILTKKPGYDAAAERIAAGLAAALPGIGVDFARLKTIVPIHPATLSLLEEIRDRFSQARGVVDFVVTRLRGDPAKGIPPFLDEPWGSLLTPEVIVDHFRDLFEVQPEFIDLAQQVFPWYQRALPELFERPAQRTLAERVLKLLMLVHLSPVREAINVREAAGWLLFSATTVDPSRNVSIVQRVLDTLVERGRYVAERGGAYRLDLRDDGTAAFEQQLRREVAELTGKDAIVLEALVPLLPAEGFNPFVLPRERWQHRQALWHFHPRRYALWLGDGDPPPVEGLALCLRLPWGERRPAPPDMYTLIPARLPVDEDLVELAALVRLSEGPLAPGLKKRVARRMERRAPAFQAAVRGAWLDAQLLSPPDAHSDLAPRFEERVTLDRWTEPIVAAALRRTYPAFERFAPEHGPLPREAWLRFMRFARDGDIGAPDVDEFVKLVREAYLCPMGLMRRRGPAYAVAPNLDRHELVRLLAPLLQHSPAPATVHTHLANPVYGLVTDQINALLVFLLLQGEIDIVKDGKSYREGFETLPNPIHYDRIEPGHALSVDHLRALERLCEGLGIATPKQWTVLAQRRSAEALRAMARSRIAALQPMASKLRDIEPGRALLARVERHIAAWQGLDAGESALQGVEQFLYQISSVPGFLEEVRAFEGLAERVERLLGEVKRYQHLLRHSALTEGNWPPAAELLERLQALGEMPGLETPERLEAWLVQVGNLYETYKAQYRERHAAWWQEAAGEQHPVWRWQVPRLAASRHLGLGRSLNEMDTCRRDVAALRCTGLVNLDYQPICSCGFDGETAPIARALERFEKLRKTIDEQLRLFFAQSDVKARLREWQKQGLEMSPETSSYLAGKQAVPVIRDVALFDEFMGGLDLVKEMDAGVVLALLEERTWEPAGLVRALERLLADTEAKRVRFKAAAGGGGLPEEVVQWCGEQALRSGTALPKGLGAEALAAIGAHLGPQHVGPLGVAQLEGLGLDEATVDKVLGWLVAGQAPLPTEGDAPGSLSAAVGELRSPSVPRAPEDLSVLADALYRQHRRMARVAGKPWLDRLANLAATPLDGLPDIRGALAPYSSAQWLLVDCLGLALAPALRPAVERALAAWKPPVLSFAKVATATTTDALYRELLAADFNHAFEKTNVLDALIHETPMLPFGDLAARAATELEIACKEAATHFDPAVPLLVFADHGFRIAADGRRYGHGGASTLERVVPVWLFQSWSAY